MITLETDRTIIQLQAQMDEFKGQRNTQLIIDWSGVEKMPKEAKAREDWHTRDAMLIMELETTQNKKKVKVPMKITIQDLERFMNDCRVRIDELK